MPQTINLADHQMVALTRASLAALRGALFRDAGPAAAGYLQEAGYAGESLILLFRRNAGELEGGGAGPLGDGCYLLLDFLLSVDDFSHFSSRT